MSYKMKFAGWPVMTNFFFGRWGPEISYDHSIWTGKWISKEEPAVLFANCLGFRLRYGNVLGIGSKWDFLTAEELEPACQEVVEHCHMMFEALPSLLAGIELETLTI